MYDFKGRTALVTGARQGIGKAIAMRLAKEGADIAILDLGDRDGGIPQALQDSRDEIASLGVRAEIFLTDVSNEKAVHDSVDAAAAAFGKIDFVVTAAGIGNKSDSLEVTTQAEMELVYKINTIGTMNVCHAVAPYMKERGFGRIVNIGSINGMYGTAGCFPYNASKWAVIGISKSLAVELGPFNINVNCVNPGFTWTPMWEITDRRVWEETYPGKPYEKGVIFKQANKGNLLPEIVEPEDIAASVAFLLSDEAKRITGAHINVDCGVLNR